MRRSLLSLAMALALVVTVAGQDASAKPGGRDGRAIQDLAKLMTAVQYAEGVGYAVAAVAKYKQHKDNPTSPGGASELQSNDAPSFDDALPAVDEDECPPPSSPGVACLPGQDG